MVYKVSALHRRYKDYLNNFSRFSEKESQNDNPKDVVGRKFLAKKKVLPKNLEKDRTEILKDLEEIINKISSRFRVSPMKHSFKEENCDKAFEGIDAANQEIKAVQKLIDSFLKKDKLAVAYSFSRLKGSYHKSLANQKLWKHIFRGSEFIDERVVFNRNKKEILVSQPKHLCITGLQKSLSNLFKAICTGIYVRLEKGNELIYSDASMVDLAILARKGEQFFALFENGNRSRLVIKTQKGGLSIKTEHVE